MCRLPAHRHPSKPRASVPGPQPASFDDFLAFTTLVAPVQCFPGDVPVVELPDETFTDKNELDFFAAVDDMIGSDDSAPDASRFASAAATAGLPAASSFAAPPAPVKLEEHAPSTFCTQQPAAAHMQAPSFAAGQVAGALCPASAVYQHPPTADELAADDEEQARQHGAHFVVSRGRRPKTQEEIEQQQERIKKRRRESAQRSRARKNCYVKNIEAENQALKLENESLRAMLRQLQADHGTSCYRVLPPQAAAAGAVLRCDSGSDHQTDLSSLL